MADPLVTRAQLEACLGADVIRRFFDKNNDGVADKPSVDLICQHATSKVIASIPGYNPADLTPANAAVSTELSRLALDAAVAMIAKWWPSASPFTWVDLMAQLDRELDMVRKGQANLGSRTNPAEADHSVSVVSGASSADFWP
jgi:hypothetical protein